MRFRDLLSEDKAVSPVIGVVLMVAITVVLAAVIGTFVLGLGDQVQETNPNSSFQFDYQSGTLTITHSGGDAVDADELFVIVDGTRSGWGGDTDGDGLVKAGHSDTASVTEDSSVRVVWDDTGSDNSATLAEWN